MTDKERLIKLIVKFGCEEYGGNSKCDGDCFERCKNCETTLSVGDLAEQLIENGVIVPPCKVGDTVFRCVFHKDGSGFIVEDNVVGFHLGEFSRTVRNRRREYLVIYHKVVDSLSRINLNEIGKTVFLSREEAEKALAERSVNNG